MNTTWHCFAISVQLSFSLLANPLEKQTFHCTVSLWTQPDTVLQFQCNWAALFLQIHKRISLHCMCRYEHNLTLFCDFSATELLYSSNPLEKHTFHCTVSLWTQPDTVLQFKCNCMSCSIPPNPLEYSTHFHCANCVAMNTTWYCFVISVQLSCSLPANPLE